MCYCYLYKVDLIYNNNSSITNIISFHSITLMANDTNIIQAHCTVQGAMLLCDNWKQYTFRLSIDKQRNGYWLFNFALHRIKEVSFVSYKRICMDLFWYNHYWYTWLPQTNKIYAYAWFQITFQSTFHKFVWNISNYIGTLHHWQSKASPLK